MNLFCFVFLLPICGLYAHAAQISETRMSSDEFQFSDIIHAIQTKCEKSSERGFTDLEKSIQEAIGCFQMLGQKYDDSVHDFHEYCVQVVPTGEFHQCLASIGQKLGVCLYEEEAFLPDFLYGAFNFTVDELCETDLGARAKLQYLKEKWAGDECFRDIHNLEKVAKTCLPNLAIFRSAHNSNGKNFIVKETEICVDMVNLEDCVRNYLNKECPIRDYTKFVHFLMEPFLSWCEKHQNNLARGLTANLPLTYETTSDDFELSNITNAMRTKCERSSTHAFDDLQQSLNDAQTCFHRLAGQHVEDVHNLHEYCEKVVPTRDFHNCLPPIGQKLRLCLYPEEAFLPHFLYEAFNFTLAEYCNSSVEAREKLSYIKDIARTDRCLSQLSVIEKVAKACFPDLAIFRSAHNTNGQNFIVKESEICVDMVNLEGCVRNSLSKVCPRGDYNRLVHYVVEPFLSWCAKHQDTIGIDNVL